MAKTKKKKTSDSGVNIWAKKGIDKNEVYELFKTGMRNGDIARMVGCSYSRVSNIVREMKLEEERRKNGGLLDIDRGKVGALYRARWPLSEIAKEMNCNEEDIVSVLRAG